MQGRLIVFEGTDGSGKATQTALLCKELDRRGIPYRKLEFPRYKEESSALIRLYLSGAFGAHPDDVNAYAATTFYSVDRFASYRQDWGAFYESGGLVIADRYTTSNAVHQTPKLPKEEREGYLKWLFDFEYRLLELPEPDRVVYLDLPTELSEQMLSYRPESHCFLTNLGSYMFVVKHDSKAALKCYNKVLKKHPDDYPTIRNCVILARTSKDVKLEKKYLRMLLEVTDDPTEQASAKVRLENL